MPLAIDSCKANAFHALLEGAGLGGDLDGVWLFLVWTEPEESRREILPLDHLNEDWESCLAFSG
jgi:hypothetical protein